MLFHSSMKIKFEVSEHREKRKVYLPYSPPYRSIFITSINPYKSSCSFVGIGCPVNRFLIHLLKFATVFKQDIASIRFLYGIISTIVYLQEPPIKSLLGRMRTPK